MKRAFLGLAVLAALIPFKVGASDATFVAATSNPNSTFATAADFNTVAVTLTDPGANLRGTVTLAASATSGRGIANVKIQTSAAGANTWADVCTDTSAAYTCDYVTSTDGLRDIRAVATDTAGYTRTSAVIANRRVDNTAPATATLTDPGANLSATVTLNAAATDAGSGIASVRIERAPAGTSTWTEICTDTSTPYSCAFDTTTATDALYDLRSVATDVAGNTRTSTTIANRRVDNNGPTVTLTDPGSPLRGTVTLNATAADPAGITSVVIQRKTTAGSTWTTICTDNSAPYSCSWATTGSGSYDLRATATDTLSKATTTATIAARLVDNTAPTASNVQAVNVSGTQYRVDAGDTLTFTYSEPIAPASILAGWTGTSQAVNVLLNNAGTSDTLTINNAANTAKLPLTGTTELQLRADHTAAGARFAATMTMSGNSIVITVGAVASGASKAVTTSIAMRWTPNSAVTDIAGNAGSTTLINESGTTDRDF